MPSLHQMILNLISGIDDPSIRVEVSRTIFYLYNIYASGGVEEREVRDGLEDVVGTVLRAKFPDMEKEEFKAMVKRTVDEFMQAFKLTTMLRRTIARAPF